MNNEVTFLAFRTICNFVNDLTSVYGSKYKPLRLYHRLINQTQIGHVEAIDKHVSIFRDFCVQNRDAIYENNSSKIRTNTVTYSNKVYINFSHVFDIADPDTKPIIWRHLLTISAILDPAGNAKNILKNISENKTEDEKVGETDFLSDMIDKVGKNIDPNASPTEAISSLMKSGLMTDILGSMENGLKNGQLDMSKLLGSVQKMVGSLKDQVGDDPDAKQAVSLIDTMVGSMNNGEQPNLGSMMSMVSSLMLNGNNNLPKPK